MKKKLDKIQGCLIGGAAGDALGFTVEFLSMKSICTRYGEGGIRQYQLQNGLAQISDDTQMTLFTANGLLVATTRGCVRGIHADYSGYIAQAYREWYKTQVLDFHQADRDNLSCWLMNVKELYADRAPGNTCMSAIDNGCRGTIQNPANDSKGCGGVMRVAPIGLYFSEAWDDREIDMIGAQAAALTHGHEMGYIPAAMLVHIIRYLSLRENVTLKEAVLDSMDAMEALFPEAEYLQQFLELIQKAMELADSSTPELEAIHSIGPGWSGDQALAVAIYCALKYENDFDKAIIAAVNHSGDSDSTGAITGNILGAHLGLSGIPGKYLENLELKDVILEIAGDLYDDCQLDEFSISTSPKDIAWEKKYVFVTYPQTT